MSKNSPLLGGHGPSSYVNPSSSDPSIYYQTNSNYQNNSNNIYNNNNNNNNSIVNSQPILGSSDDIVIESIPRSRKFTPVNSFWNTVKGFAGAGSFALPWAMSNAGVFIGSIGLILIALLSNYTMTILLKCNSKLADEQLGTERAPPSYADLGRRAYGRVGELIVCFVNLSVTMSISVAFLILIGSNFGMLTGLSPSYTIWICVPIVASLSTLTNMKYLGFTSIFGALALIMAMVTVIAYGIKDYPIHSLSEYEVDYSKIPLWFGVASYFFCNHIVVVPISHDSGDCHKYPRILDAAMVFITIINVLFAVLGYLYFNFAIVNGVVGVPSNIVEALPDGTFANLVRMCVVFELVCSFPIVFVAGINVVDSSIDIFHRHFTAFPNNDVLRANGSLKFFSRNWKYYIFRFTLVCVLAAIASTIKTFGSYMSLIGSLMLSTTGFVLPPLIYMRFFEQSLRSKILHYAIVLFGIAATGLGTYQSIMSLIHPVKSDD